MILMFFSSHSSSVEGFLFLLQTLASLMLVACGLVTDLPTSAFLCAAALMQYFCESDLVERRSERSWSRVNFAQKVAGSEF